jgi:hypothetical protein
MNGALDGRLGTAILRAPRRTIEIMANTPKWNIRMRHEWLATPLKMKRIKRCQSARVGLLDAQLRKKAKEKKSGSEQG